MVQNVSLRGQFASFHTSLGVMRRPIFKELVGYGRTGRTSMVPMVKSVNLGLHQPLRVSQPTESNGSTPRQNGRKIASWVKFLQRDLPSELERLRKMGVKFDCRTLRHLELAIIEDSDTAEYNSNMVDAKSGKLSRNMVTPRWVQTFAERNRIVSRSLTDKLLLSPAKEFFNEKEVAFHLGELARLFRNEMIDENDIENADETHF